MREQDKQVALNDQAKIDLKLKKNLEKKIL